MPSSSTVQAPQTPCSQPTWTPVSPSSWRRKSDSSMRGCTAATSSRPLTRIRTEVRSVDTMRLRAGRGGIEGPLQHGSQQLLAVPGRIEAILLHFNSVYDRPRRFLDEARGRPLPHQRLLGRMQPDGGAGSAGDPGAHVLHAVVGVEIDSGSGGSKCEV